MKKDSPVLVTGGCGYIGSHVTRQLSESGYPVVVLDDLSTGSKDMLVHGEKLIIGSTGDSQLLQEIFSEYSFRSVLHFAGSIVVPESVSEPAKYYENNTFNLLKLLKVCQKFQVRNFVFSSTAAVYGENLEEALPETFPLNPTNPYSRSKLMGEWMIEDLSRVAGFRYVILRYFNVAGADPEGRMGQRSLVATHLIKIGCECLVGKRKEVFIFGEDYPTPDGTGVRDYIHVEDLASAHLAALRYLDNDGKSTILNCGYGKGSSVREVLDALREVGGEFTILKGPRRAGDVASLVADVRKIHSTLDWIPKYNNLREIVRTALHWELKLV